MKVKIIKSVYGNNNNKILDVSLTENGNYLYGCGINQLLILKEDAEVVEDVEKSCDNCKYDDLLGDEHPCNNCSPSRDMRKPIEQAEEKIAGVGQDAPNVKPAGKFENIGRSLGELVDEKQQAYGDAITAVEQMMMVLYPNGVNPDQYRDMLLMVRIMDKQCRIAKGDKSAFRESPWSDIAGYGLLGVGDMVAKVQFEKIYSDGKDKQIKQLKPEFNAYKIVL